MQIEVKPLLSCNKELISGFYKENILENNIREHLLRISKTLESERYGEDMLAAIDFMLENVRNQ